MRSNVNALLPVALSVAIAAALLTGATGADAQTAGAPYDPPREIAESAGPRGTSGEQRYDTVGYAGVAAPDSSMSIVAPDLAPGGYVELTALDSGRTIVALVARRSGTGGRIAALSSSAAEALGVTDGAPIRVRLVTLTPQDQNALRIGQRASARIDAPPALLVALRHRLPPPDGQSIRPLRSEAPAPPTIALRPIASPPRGKPVAPAPMKPTPPRARGGYVVQVAALSVATRADALARSVGGQVVGGGGLYRVQIGPFADSRIAKRKRDDVARHGYADARVIHIP